jgi:hypothetical protein
MRGLRAVKWRDQALKDAAIFTGITRNLYPAAQLHSAAAAMTVPRLSAILPERAAWHSRYAMGMNVACAIRSC